MQEFLEPTEERVTLPTVQTAEAQEVNCDALIAEIEDVGRLEALVTMGSICVLFSVTIALSLLLYAIPNGGLSLYIITHWKVALGEPSGIKVYWDVSCSSGGGVLPANAAQPPLAKKTG